MKNPQCEGQQCRAEHGEVRVLPTRRVGPLVLCHDCFIVAMDWRAMRNAGHQDPYELPLWADLELKKGGD